MNVYKDNMAKNTVPEVFNTGQTGGFDTSKGSRGDGEKQPDATEMERRNQAEAVKQRLDRIKFQEQQRETEVKFAAPDGPINVEADKCTDTQETKGEMVYDRQEKDEHDVRNIRECKRIRENHEKQKALTD